MKRAILCLVAVAALASPAWGQVTITCLEVGPDVVCSSPGGPIATTGLTGLTTIGSPSAVVPSQPAVVIGSASSIDRYSGLSSPGAFGAGGTTLPSTESGPLFGAAGSGGTVLAVPTGHTSGATVGASSMTFSTATFATLGMIPGTYPWTWASGTLTLQIGPPPAVPAASTAGLALLMLAALVLLAVLVGRKTSLEIAA